MDIKVIDFPLLDTKSPVNGITGKFIADSCFADFILCCSGRKGKYQTASGGKAFVKPRQRGFVLADPG